MSEPPPEPTSARLVVRRIGLDVRLGHLDDERREAQRVECDLVLRFHRVPPAVRTDALEDTVCYDDLVACMRKVVARREFRLVEHLAGELFAALRDEVDPADALELRVRKVSPPVPEIGGGAEIVLSDG